MKIELLNYVVVRADFDRPQSVDEPSGGELAAIVVEGLRLRGLIVEDPEPIDYANFVKCNLKHSMVELMIGAEILDEPGDCRWYIQPCAKQKAFGRRKTKGSGYQDLLLALNGVLHDCQRISDVNWYPSFDTPEYLALMPNSEGPIPNPDYLATLHPLIKFYWRYNHLAGWLVSPIFLFLFMVLACGLAATVPSYLPYVVAVVFFGVLAIMTVVPFVHSILVDREVRRMGKANKQ